VAPEARGHPARSRSDRGRNRYPARATRGRGSAPVDRTANSRPNAASANPSSWLGDLAQFVTPCGRHLNEAPAPTAASRCHADPHARAAIEDLAPHRRAHRRRYGHGRLEGSTRRPRPGRRPPCWVHSDLMPSNLLVTETGSPRSSTIRHHRRRRPRLRPHTAWNCLPASARQIFRDKVNVDDATWTRGRGWVCPSRWSAPYYRNTNPIISATPATSSGNPHHSNRMISNGSRRSGSRRVRLSREVTVALDQGRVRVTFREPPSPLLVLIRSDSARLITVIREFTFGIPTSRCRHRRSALRRQWIRIAMLFRTRPRATKSDCGWRTLKCSRHLSVPASPLMRFLDSATGLNDHAAP